MKHTIQFRIFRGESQFVAECMDLAAVTQGRTLDEVAANIREAVALYLEGEDPAEFGLAPNAILVAVLELEQAA
ncbi:MAG: type II toxin-antitoxin system HicB family antitoxin [Acidobacteria bacterium]|nr:type II toxin-antitoxin system HicB family antitoxin [Acidobacteriota bacterium]